MSLTYDYDFSTLTPITGTELQAQFDKVKDKFNGNIDNGDIATDAAISTSKLGTITTPVSYEVNLIIPGKSGGFTLTNGDQSGAYYGMWHFEDDGNSKITRITWSCNEVGAGTGEFDMEWGYFKNSGTAGDWVGTLVNDASEVLAEVGGGTSGYGHGEVSMSGNEFTLSSQTRAGFLRLKCDVADNTALVADSNLLLTVRVERDFTAS